MDEQAKQLNFHDLLEIASRRRWLIVVCVLVVGITGTFFAMAKPDTYSASTVFLVKDPQVVAELYGTSLVAVPFARRLNTVEEDVRSMDTILSVVEDLNLAGGGRSSNAVAGQILSELSVRVLETRRGDTTVILGYTDVKPRVAANVVNQTRQKYIDGLVEEYMVQVKRVWDQYMDQVKTLEELQEERREKLREFDSKHQFDTGKVSKTKTELQRVERDIAQIDTRLEQKELQLQKTQDALRSMSRVKEEPVRERNPRFDKALERLMAKKKEVQELEEKWTEKYPPLKLARVELDKAQAAVDEEPEFLVKDVKRETSRAYLAESQKERELKQQILTLKARKGDLEDRKRNLDRTARGLPRLKKEYSQLEAAIESGNEALSQATAEENRARFTWETARESGQHYFETIDEARVPQKPSGPKRAAFIAASILGGLGLGFGLSVLLHLLSRSLLSVTDAKSFLDVPVMGTVQTIQSNLELERGRRRRAMAAVMVMIFVVSGVAFTVVYTQYPELLPGFVRDSISAFRQQIR